VAQNSSGHPRNGQDDAFPPRRLGKFGVGSQYRAVHLIPSRNEAYYRVGPAITSSFMRQCTTHAPTRARWCSSMWLTAQLDACRRAFEAGAEPELVATVHAAIRHLSESHITGKAVKAGDRAPPFRLRDEPGGVVLLADLLARGPVVLSFFRGEWCSYCALELAALAEATPDIERLGATVLALSPHISERASPCGRDEGRPFPMLKDRGGGIARQYRIAFTVPRQFRAAYLAIGFPKPVKSLPTTWRLPIPATYVVDNAGRVVLSYLDADHTTRLEPAEIIRALTGLRMSGGSGIPERNNG
jgi:peroxiredoxin